MPIRVTAGPAAPRTSLAAPLLRQGASGPQVAALQAGLSARGFPCTTDGLFGPGTRAAVLAFQRSRGLEADAVVGPRTWAALRGPVTAPRPDGNGRSTTRLGSSGAAVVELQRALARSGFNPGRVDGAFGPATLAAVRAFQRNHGLGVDGVVGPRTWGALGGSSFVPATRPTDPRVGGEPLRRRILEIAQAEVGTLESGDNRGEVLKYPRYFGRGAEPYCADFVSWVLTRAGRPLDFAYCPSLRNHLIDTGRWKGRANPQPGDLVLFDWDSDGRADHVGLVRGVNPDGSLVTVEGNTDHPTTGRFGVWNRTRSMSDVMGFGSP